MRKTFRIRYRQAGLDVIVHEGTFDPESADVYEVQIDPKKARHSLVVQEVRKALGQFEEAVVKTFEDVPPTLKKRLGEYFPFEIWEFNKYMRDRRKKIEEGWKI